MAANSKHKDALLTLQKAGISKTSQRLAVLDILFKATTPLSVNAIRQTLGGTSIDHIEINISGLCACCRNATEQMI
jgi:Fe2+ or Zn2+ uptake regulation protein